MTPQRRVIASVLSGTDVHLSAEEVLEQARQRLPEVSLATVYNTLNELVAMGEVLEVRAAPGPARYDPNVAPAHHHLVCSGCGSLFDVRPRGVDHLHLPDAQRRGFALDEVDVVFRGRCPRCQE